MGFGVVVKGVRGGGGVVVRGVRGGDGGSVERSEWLGGELARNRKDRENCPVSQTLVENLQLI